MADNFNDFVDELMGNDLGTAAEDTKRKSSKYARQTFTCESCNGTGRWSGGRNRHGNAKCNACHGVGHFVTSPADRAKARTAAKVSKAKKIEAAQEANMAHGDGALVRFLVDNASWNEFCRSLLEQHNEGRTFSEKQVAAARRMWAKVEERRRERKAAAEAANEAAPVVDLSRIKAMFDTAVANGYKRPAYRAEGFVISRAPDHGMNKGHLYVKSEDDVYMGKIAPDMKFKGTRDSNGSGVETALLAIAADPLGAALRYGSRTGRCACCGRELTNHTSITRGIGPICADKWGLGDVQMNLTTADAKVQIQDAGK